MIPILAITSIGRLAMTTSAPATSRWIISLLCGRPGSSVRLRLLRFSERNIPPSPPLSRAPRSGPHFHFLRAHVGQQHAAVRSGDEPAEIDHWDPFERACLIYNHYVGV